MAKEPGHRPTDGSTFVAALEAIAAGAYGLDWHQRGRSHLGEAALLLAALWPAGAPPALQGSTVERLLRFRRISGLRAAVAVGAVAVVAAAGTALAVRGPAPRTPAHSVAAVQQISLQPSSPSALSSRRPPVKPSPKITVAPSWPAGQPASTPPAVVPAPAVSATSASSKPAPKPSKKPSPKPSPMPSPSPAPTPSPTPSATLHPPSSAPPPFSYSPPQTSTPPPEG